MNHSVAQRDSANMTQSLLRVGTRSTYEKNGYKPDFDKLPLEEEYRAAKEELDGAKRPI